MPIGGFGMLGGRNMSMVNISTLNQFPLEDDPSLPAAPSYDPPDYEGISASATNEGASVEQQTSTETGTTETGTTETGTTETAQTTTATATVESSTPGTAETTETADDSNDASNDSTAGGVDDGEFLHLQLTFCFFFFCATATVC